MYVCSTDLIALLPMCCVCVCVCVYVHVHACVHVFVYLHVFIKDFVLWPTNTGYMYILHVLTAASIVQEYFS